jgi:hypothetical protein
MFMMKSMFFKTTRFRKHQNIIITIGEYLTLLHRTTTLQMLLLAAVIKIGTRPKIRCQRTTSTITTTTTSGQPTLLRGKPLPNNTKSIIIIKSMLLILPNLHLLLLKLLSESLKFRKSRIALNNLLFLCFRLFK